MMEVALSHNECIILIIVDKLHQQKRIIEMFSLMKQYQQLISNDQSHTIIKTFSFSLHLFTHKIEIDLVSPPHISVISTNENTVSL